MTGAWDDPVSLCSWTLEPLCVVKTALQHAGGSHHWLLCLFSAMAATYFRAAVIRVVTLSYVLLHRLHHVVVPSFQPWCNVIFITVTGLTFLSVDCGWDWTESVALSLCKIVAYIPIVIAFLVTWSHGDNVNKVIYNFAWFLAYGHGWREAQLQFAIYASFRVIMVSILMSPKPFLVTTNYCFFVQFRQLMICISVISGCCCNFSIYFEITF